MSHRCCKCRRCCGCGASAYPVGARLYGPESLCRVPRKSMVFMNVGGDVREKALRDVEALVDSIRATASDADTVTLCRCVRGLVAVVREQQQQLERVQSSLFEIVG
jgi:hypothetical protein